MYALISISNQDKIGEFNFSLFLFLPQLLPYPFPIHRIYSQYAYIFFNFVLLIFPNVNR